MSGRIFKTYRRAGILPFLLCILIAAAGSIPLSAGERKDNAKGRDESAVTARHAKEKSAAPAAEKANEGDAGPIRDFSEDEFRPKVEEESTGWMIIKTIFILGLLVGGFWYFFRFVTKKAGLQILGQDVFRVLSVKPIGQNKFLHVIDLAGKILVIGVCDNNINLLSEIKDRDEIDRIRLLSSRSMPAREESFQDHIIKNLGKVISKMMDRRGGGHAMDKTAAEDHGVDLEFLKKQKTRLKNLNGEDHE